MPRLLTLMPEWLQINGSQNSGKHSTYYYQFIIKDTAEEQLRRNAEGNVRGKGCRASMPFFLRLHVFTNPEAPGTHSYWVLWRHHYMGMIDWVNYSGYDSGSSTSLLGSAWEVGLISCNNPIMPWCLWWRPAPILKLSRSPPRVASSEQKTLLSLLSFRKH